MKKAGTEQQSSKPDRKTIERNRRIHMKGLCFQLASLIPFQRAKDMSQQELLDVAATYIKHLREKIEKLQERKEEAKRSLGLDSNVANTTGIDDDRMTGTRLPLLEVRETGSSIQVILATSGLKRFILREVISILEEEGAQVVAVNFSAVADKVFYTIHAQVKVSRVGVDTSRVWQRLHELIVPP